MTLEKVSINEDYILFAFTSRDRKYIKCLSDRCNHLLGLIFMKKATEQEDLEYYSLKWILKQFAVTDKEYLKKIKEKK